MELSQLIKDIKFDVVQVQQWLTDISATRGLDGLDDGKQKAAEFAELFSNDTKKAKELAQKLNQEDVVAAKMMSDQSCKLKEDVEQFMKYILKMA